VTILIVRYLLVIALFQSEQFKAEQESAIEDGGQDISSDLFYMKQYVGNACGAVALIHALANNAQRQALFSLNY
jgi:ubiquitin carboxyl-terminal hydrolase L3